MYITNDGSAEPSPLDQLLVDWSALGVTASFEELLEQLTDERDFQRVFDCMPAKMQTAIVGLAILNRDNFGRLLAGAKDDPAWTVRWSAFRDWALARADVINAPAPPKRAESRMDKMLRLERAIEEAESEDEKERLRSELHTMDEEDRWDASGCDLVTGWHRDIIERRARMATTAEPRRAYPVEVLIVDDRTNRHEAEVLENRLAQLDPANGFETVFDKLDPEDQVKTTHLALLNRDNFGPVVDAATGDEKWVARWNAFREWALARPQLAKAEG